MEMTQIQLPTQLVGEIQQSIPRDKTIEQVVVEAIEFWLTHQQHRPQTEQALQILRQTGLVMSQERQSTWAHSLKTKLVVDDETINRERVEAALANFSPPLSEEIIAMRGEW